ncbi:MAG: cytochrome c biogenesis protein CcsA [Cytophagales bacterium]|nr:cytochrome c biogenesis protein CcsA [Armatimonadota bacterium]
MTGSAATLSVTLALYLVGAALLGANLFVRRPGFLAAGRWAAVLAVILHGVSIGLRCVEVHRAPFTNPAESLSLLSWIVALVYLGTEVLWKLSASGPFALSLSFLLVLFGAALGAEPGAGFGAGSAQLLSQRAITLHILAIITAIAAFALAFCCAALYLIENHILKSKHGLTWMKRLPPLLTVESAAFTLAAVGFPLLTIGILSGLVRAIPGGMAPGWQMDPKILLAYAVWGVYGVYLWGRMGAKWPPVRTAYVLLVGFVLCILLYIVPTAAHLFK